MTLEAVDLFCGIGGLTHGIKISGIKVIAGIDIDATCEFAYSHNNKSIFILHDVGKYPSSKISEFYSNDSIKILMGCAPCQPFSRLQKNIQDKNKNSKWGLLYSFLKHIKNIAPEIVSMENVPSLRKEVVFSDFVRELIKMGYDVNYNIIDASDYGVPQRRKRLLLLASRIGRIEFIPPTHKNNKITVRQAIAGLPEIGHGEISESDPLHRSSSLNDINFKRIIASLPGGTWNDWDRKILPNCYRKESGKTFSSVYGRMKYDDISPTLTTQFNRYGTGRYGHPIQNRAISLREGAILQSFPKNYKFVKNKNYAVTEVARQIGNAVPVRLGEIIGISITDHINKLNKNEK